MNESNFSVRNTNDKQTVHDKQHKIDRNRKEHRPFALCTIRNVSNTFAMLKPWVYQWNSPTQCVCVCVCLFQDIQVIDKQKFEITPSNCEDKLKPPHGMSNIYIRQQTRMKCAKTIQYNTIIIVMMMAATKHSYRTTTQCSLCSCFE